nr:hypothetical protein [Tanacetum cinerariifolium]
MAILPNNILCGKSNFTMTKLRFYVLKRGCSAILISNGSFPTDQERFPENPIRGFRVYFGGFDGRVQFLKPMFIDNLACASAVHVYSSYFSSEYRRFYDNWCVLLLAQYFFLSYLPHGVYESTLPTLSLCRSPNAKVALNLWLLGSDFEVSAIIGIVSVNFMEMTILGASLCIDGGATIERGSTLNPQDPLCRKSVGVSLSPLFKNTISCSPNLIAHLATLLIFSGPNSACLICVPVRTIIVELVLGLEWFYVDHDGSQNSVMSACVYAKMSALSLRKFPGYPFFADVKGPSGLPCFFLSFANRQYGFDSFIGLFQQTRNAFLKTVHGGFRVYFAGFDGRVQFLKPMFIDNCFLDLECKVSAIIGIVSVIFMEMTVLVGLCVADFRTGNHLEDDFTPLETIRRLCSVFGRRSLLGFEEETFEPKGRQSEVLHYLA